MSEADEKYVLDANVFIQAKRRFYDFDFCPGYWRVLIYYNREGRLSSIDRVQEELKRGGDDLWDWAEQQFGANAFVDTSFDVECISPFEMLRRLGVQLNWSPPR